MDKKESLHKEYCGDLNSYKATKYMSAYRLSDSRPLVKFYEYPHDSRYGLKSINKINVMIWLQGKENSVIYADEIAQSLCITPSQASRILTQLKKQNLISYNTFCVSKTYYYFITGVCYLDITTLCPLGLNVDCDSCLLTPVCKHKEEKQ